MYISKSRLTYFPFELPNIQLEKGYLMFKRKNVGRANVRTPHNYKPDQWPHY